MFLAIRHHLGCLAHPVGTPRTGLDVARLPPSPSGGQSPVRRGCGEGQMRLWPSPGLRRLPACSFPQNADNSSERVALECRRMGTLIARGSRSRPAVPPRLRPAANNVRILESRILGYGSREPDDHRGLMAALSNDAHDSRGGWHEECSGTRILRSQAAFLAMAWATAIDEPRGGGV